MSSEDDGGVILIASESKNQDGTQTYYILDPCPSSEHSEKSKIELIDLTAEVTNTGAIAVLSTNSDTGDIEIRLNKTIEEEEKLREAKIRDMDSSEGISEEGFSIDEMNINTVKNEEEDVDIENVSLNDSQMDSQDQLKSEADAISYPEFSSSEFDAINIEMEESKELQNQHDEQECSVEEAEEGVLYIDDFSNIQDNQTQGNQESTDIGARVKNNVGDVDRTLGQIKHMIEEAEFVLKETSSLQALNHNVAQKAISEEALIHGHLIEVPTQSQQHGTQPPDIEFVDSTNTALTLLELAGGSYRNLNEEDQLPVNADLENQSSEYTTLTTLQPIEVEAHNGAVAAQQAPEHDPNQASTKMGTSANVNPKLSQEMLRLIEGDIPRDIRRNSIRRSQVVSTNEIVEEVLERTRSKIPYSNTKDFIFTNKLAHRLANRIVSVDVDKPDSGSESASSTPSSRKGSISHSTDGIITPSQRQTSAISDKYELLKILEDDPDDPVDLKDVEQSRLINKVLNKRTRIPKKPKEKVPPLIKLHPELEKELALKQLENFVSNKRGGRKSSLLNVAITPKKEKEEHNNNSSVKRRGPYTTVRAKRVKKENASAVTADRSEITETLVVEGQGPSEELSKDSKHIKQYSNKRLSRNSETPPKEIPMEILLNGVEEENYQAEDGKVKNKIFKSTNPRKRQEELKKAKQKHFAKVLQRVQPHKKRGRPPKRKVPVDDKFKDDIVVMLPKQDKAKNGVKKSSDEGESPASKENQFPKGKKLTEIEKLLGDEGAINMLYSVEQKKAGGEQKQGVLPSYRRKKKDLILKTKLVKSAVLRLTANLPLQQGKISLRGKPVKEGEQEESPEAAALRKMSVDSRDSHHSVNSTSETFPLPDKVVPAEASRIIRRHSSSSNYSSRSNSPRRLSVEMGERPDFLTPEVPEMAQGDTSLSSQSSGKHKHSKTPHLQTPKGEPLLRKTAQERTRGKSATQPPETTPTTPLNNTKPKIQPKKTTPTGKPRGRPRRIVASALERGLTEDELKMRNELHSSLTDVVDEFTGANENVNGNVPKTTVPKTNSTPKVAVYKKSGTQETKQSKVYKELTLKRHNFLVEIILAPVSTKLKNALNPSVLREVTTVLGGLTQDENCRVVLLSSVGDVFCQGVDFCSLVHEASDKRTGAALDMAVAIKEFVKALAMFTKPVVAAVQGPAVGLGVTMLPLFDLVIASDKATFHTPYARLGQIPEGAATLTLPTLLGYGLTSELLFTCRKLTASEALNLGLVTRVLWGEHFHEQLLPTVTAMAAQSAQSMDATKALLRHNLLSGLDTTLVSETHLLIQQWTGAECQSSFTRYLSEEETLALHTQPT